MQDNGETVSDSTTENAREDQAFQIIENNGLFVADGGQIQIVSAIDIAPFFEEKLENKFYSLRNSIEFNKLVRFNGGLHKKIIKDNKVNFCSFDEGTMEMEKMGYDLEIFRGIIYSDYFTPTYKITKSELLEKLKDETDKIERIIEELENKKNELEEESKDDKIETFKLHQRILERLREIFENNWEVSVKISKGGVAYVFLDIAIPETSEKLSRLPVEVKFPEDLKYKIHYDDSQELLIFKMVMSKEERDTLLSLSADDSYGKAIKLLFQRSQIKKEEAGRNRGKGIPLGDFFNKVSELQSSPYLEAKNEIENEIEKINVQISNNVAGIDELKQNIKDFERRSYELKRISILKSEQVFNTYLWAMTIYTINIFFRETGFYSKIKDLIHAGYIDPNKILKKPHEVSYSLSFTKESPPARNYLVMYHFPSEIIGSVVTKRKTNKKKIPKDIKLSQCYDCPPRREDCPFINKYPCLIQEFGSAFISLLYNMTEDTGDVQGFKPPQLKKRRLERIPVIDQSCWTGELCLVEAEATLISYMPKKVYANGIHINSDIYWRCIMRGLGFLTGGKTLIQVIHRTLIRTTMDFKQMRIGELNGEDPKKKEEKNEKRIIVLSDLLNKIRIALTPSMISRTPHARAKFSKYLEISGIDSLLKIVEVSFRDLNAAFSNYLEVKRQKKSQKVTIYGFILGAFVALLTLIQVVRNWQSNIDVLK